MAKLLRLILFSLLILTSVSAHQMEKEKPQTKVEIIFFQHNFDTDYNDIDQYSRYDNTYTSNDIKDKLYSHYNIENIFLANKALLSIERAENTLTPLKEEVDSDILHPYIGIMAGYNNWNNFSKRELLPNSEKDLLKVEKKLVNNFKNKVIFHIVLEIDTNTSEKQNKFILDSNTLSKDDYFDNIQSKSKGNLSINISKNIDFETKINICDKNISEYFTAKRRMKKEQLNYIDGNKYGMFVFASSINKN
ncbi:MAG: hypothetical protein HON78_01900 [Legionellales bacterium]|jgi:hypothetical protein|nr:hypothetical protein [Legionellales bacterium]